MKIKYLLFLCFALSLSLTVDAQTRYLDQVFDEVQVTSNVPFGANFTVIRVPIDSTTLKQPLVMDIYQPAGDSMTNRPLVIYLHTGNFLPIMINGGVTGSKTDSATVEVCTRLAKLGYVVASADYRMGWNPFATSASERTFGLINAAYRGLQDARTAVRFFKRDVTEAGNTFGIDTSKIVMWGEGTGGYIALAAAHLDEYNEIIGTTMPQGKFLTDLDGDPSTLEPMVIEAFNGDIYGTSLGLAPGPFPPAGDTLCLPNHVGYNSDFHLCVNMGGALGDLAWMDDDEVPLIAFQVPLDEFAPYESRILDVPSPQGPLPVVEVQGARLIVELANTQGRNDVFATVDDEWTDAAKAASAAAGHDYLNGLFPFNRPANALGRVDGSPWNWWDVDTWNAIPHPTAGTGQVPADATFHTIALSSNLMMSPEKGRTYVDTIIGYYAPRAFLALGLDSSSTSIPTLSKEQVNLVLAPNPSPGYLQLTTASDQPMQRIILRDVTGRSIHLKNNLNTSNLRWDQDGIAPGMYFMEIHFEQGKITEKVLFN